MQTNQLIELLLDPRTYPHPVELITTIETHISIVFLTGEFAYKLKKPVNFGFLDFSTLEKRKTYCELELSLNQRSAPQLYLSVCPLYFFDRTQTLSFEPNVDSPLPFEYLVKMRQFDPNLVLGKYLQTETLNDVQIKTLAQTIAGFHATAVSASKETDFGHPDNVIQPMLDNFPSLLSTFEHPEIQYRLRQLADWTVYTQKSLWESLLARKVSGFVRACHGDMHLDNITLIDDQPTLFDGIEFNEQFRWIDTLNDLAFLLIDLDYRQQYTLRRQLLNLYINHTGDYDGLKHLKFYQVYRAMVRAKITALRYFQLTPQSYEAQLCWEKSLDYLKQAEDYAYEIKTPTLILMQGVSGSGKSYYAQQIAKLDDFITISSDRERKRLFGLSPLDRVDELTKQRLYAPQMNERTYSQLQTITQQLLTSGFSVIVDATFLKAAHRTPFKNIAAELHANFLIFSIETDSDIASQQIIKREQQDTDPSDANVAIMQQQLDTNEPPESAPNIWRQPPGQPLAIDAILPWLQQELLQ